MPKFPPGLLLKLFAALPLSITSAYAADYPVRPVRVIVPFVAGGGTDLLGRFVSQRLTELLGQQFIVDNRGGAGSILGTQILAKSTPDGYTLGVLDTAFVINHSFADKLPYDSERDFNFVAIIATSPSLFVVHPGLKIRSVPDLVAAAKRQPGKITFGSAGVGSSSHLTLQMFLTAAQINILHVPFKGAGAAIVDVLGGHTDITSVVPGTVMPHIKSGAMIPLVITGTKPYHMLPNVPTFAAAGFPTVNPGQFRFLAAPTGLRADVHKKLSATMRLVMEPQDFRTRLIDNGFEPELLLDPEARKYIDVELRKWRQAVKDAKAK